LPPARAGRVQEHVDDCEDCAAVVALLRGEARRLRAIPLWLLLPAVPAATSGLAGAGVLDGSQPSGVPAQPASPARRGHRKPRSPKPGALVGIAASGIAILMLATGAVTQLESANGPHAPRVVEPRVVADPPPTAGDGGTGAMPDQPEEPTDQTSEPGVRPVPDGATSAATARAPEFGTASVAFPVEVVPSVQPLAVTSSVTPSSETLPATKVSGPPPRWFRASTKGKRVACLKHDLRICSLRP
jgi:hypothetical protein